MTTTADAPPDDIGALRALILAERAERAQFAERSAILERLNTRLEYIVAELKRAHFGRKSERITDGQLTLALDELETAAAKTEAEAEKADPARKAAAARKRGASRDRVQRLFQARKLRVRWALPMACRQRSRRGRQN
jgi:hypothetical protein